MASFTSRYQTDIDNLINELKNSKFNYDYRTDSAYQAYAKDLDNQSKAAQESTLGTLSKRTFGLPSSYAVSEVTNIGNQYAKQKSDAINDYRQAALNLYNNNLTQRQNLLNSLLSLRDQEYTMYQNELAAEAARLQAAYRNSGSGSGSGSSRKSSSGSGGISYPSDLVAALNSVGTAYNKYGKTAATQYLANVYRRYGMSDLMTATANRLGISMNDVAKRLEEIERAYG